MSQIFNKNPYIIAEVGQNHQGSVARALDYVKEFARLGADAVKFQKRDNRFLFDQKAYDKEYNSPTSFGLTYGEHREHLELTNDEMREVKGACDDANIDFICTPFDEPSLEFLVSIGTTAIKIASFDLGNLPFINKIAKTQIPVIMSVGGGKIDQIESSVDVIKQHHSKAILLHCVSEYPCPPEHLGLSQIQMLAERFPDLVIGSSDHFNGTLSGPVARMLGAAVFEKHVTFNRAEKGTDHSFSLEPEGFRKFVRDIHRTDMMLPPKSKENLGNEPVFVKLGKSLIADRDIAQGEPFTLENLSGKIFEVNVTPVRESNRFIGQLADRDYAKGEPIT